METTDSQVDIFTSKLSDAYTVWVMCKNYHSQQNENEGVNQIEHLY